MSLDTAVFEEYISREVGAEKFRAIKAALSQHNAIIAGGIVLGAYANFDSSDIDFYVNLKNLKPFLNELRRNAGASIYMDNMAPAYDGSFFKRNHIVVRYRGYFSLGGSLYIDVLVVDDSIAVKDVAKNFDLSCCEVWYDGNTVSAKNPNDILAKKCVLNPEYEKDLFVNNNWFIANRIQKYRKRGFKISTKLERFVRNRNNANDIEIGIRLNKKSLPQEAEEEWLIKHLVPLIVQEFEESRIFENGIDIIQTIHPGYKIQSLNEWVIANHLRGNATALKPFYKELLEPFLINRYISDRYKKIIYRFLYLRVSNLPSHRKNIPIIIMDPGKCAEAKEAIKTQKGFDLIQYDDVSNVSQYLLESKDNLVFILPDGSLFCFTKDDIDAFVQDYKHNWMYECSGVFITDTEDQRVDAKESDNPYVGLPIDMSGMKGFVPVCQVEEVVESDGQVFFVRAKKINEEQLSFTHTASWQVLFSPRPNYVGANHCQRGTNIMVYEICRCQENARGGVGARGGGGSKPKPKQK